MSRAETAKQVLSAIGSYQALSEWAEERATRYINELISVQTTDPVVAELQGKIQEARQLARLKQLLEADAQLRA